MTSAIGVERVVKRRFHLHCACGATVATNKRTATCPDCGDTIVFRKVSRWKFRQRWHTRLHSVVQELLVELGGLLMFVLVWRLFGPAFAIFLSGLALVVIGVLSLDTTRRISHDHAVPDYNRRFRWFGRLLLLLAAFYALGYSVPGHTYREQIAFLTTPKPRFCDWVTLPIGDKHCHYDPIFRRVNENIIVEWQLVND